MVLDPGRAMSGSFGRLLDESGQEVAWCNRFEVKLTYDRAEMAVLGSRMKKHKLQAISGEGTIAGFHVSSDIQAYLLADPTITFTFVGELHDPEAYGHERVRVRGVKFTDNMVMSFKAGEIIEKEMPFVFDDEPELLDAVMGTGVSLPVSVPFTE